MSSEDLFLPITLDIAVVLPKMVAASVTAGLEEQLADMKNKVEDIHISKGTSTNRQHGCNDARDRWCPWADEVGV